MPKTLKCPLCGEPFPETTSKGDPRHICGRCYGAAVAQLVMDLVRKDPRPAQARIAGLTEQLSETWPREPYPEPEEAPVAARILSFLREQDHQCFTAKEIDRAVSIRSGTAAPALAELEAAGVVECLPGDSVGRPRRARVYRARENR